MAQVFKFRRGSTDTSLIDTAGWHVAPDWVPKVASAEEGKLPPPVQEVFTIQSNYTSHDNLAAALVSLNKLRHDARRYMKDPTEPNAVWWHDSLTNETGERRVLVRRIEIEPLAEQHGPGGQGSMIDARPHYRLAVERGGAWEALEPSTGIAVYGRETLGGVFDYTSTGTVVGSAPARVNRLYIAADTTAVTFPYLWIGFRSANRHGTLANFEPLWELEDGSSDLGDTSSASDSTASGGSYVLCQFSTSADWAKRWTIQASQAVGANYADNTGHFLLLVRAKTSANTAAEIQLRHGYAGEADGDLKEGPIVEVDTDSWTEYEMGIVRIPLRGRQAITTLGISDDQTQGISIWARRTSGAGHVHLDCLNLIPIDEYFISCTRAAIYNAGGSSLPRWAMGVSPKDETYSLTQDSVVGGIRTISPINVEGVGVPVGDGRLYVVMARASKVTDVDDRYSANFNWFPRWYDLRGSE